MPWLLHSLCHLGYFSEYKQLVTGAGNGLRGIRQWTRQLVELPTKCHAVAGGHDRKQNCAVSYNWSDVCELFVPSLFYVKI